VATPAPGATLAAPHEREGGADGGDLELEDENEDEDADTNDERNE
jgi:hypothetical protein